MLPAAGESLLYPKRASGFSSFSSVMALKCFVTSSMSFGSAAPVPPRQQPAMLSFPRPSGEAMESLRAGISAASVAGSFSSSDGMLTSACASISASPAGAGRASACGTVPALHPDSTMADMTGTSKQVIILLLSNTFMIPPSLKILCYTYYIIVQNGIEISKK